MGSKREEGLSCSIYMYHHAERLKRHMSESYEVYPTLDSEDGRQCWLHDCGPR